MSVSVLVFSWPPPKDGLAKPLFSYDIVGTADFDDYWHQPARRLGLRLLAEVYGRGRVFRPEDLGPLEGELDLLERHWESLDFGGRTVVFEEIAEDGSLREESGPLRETLRRGLAAVRRAVAVARESGAMLSLG